MSAPPVLRPLRAILQRRLQIVSSRPIRTPYYIRASHYRSQLRYNSSLPPDQSPKPEESAQETSTEQTLENEVTTPAEETENAAAEPPTGSVLTPESNAESRVATTSDVSGHHAIVEAATPRLDSMLVKSAFLQLKSTDAEIQAGLAEAVARQLAADEATTVALGGAAADLEGGEGGAPIPVISDTTTQGVAEVMDSQPEVLISRETESTSLPSGAETFATIEEVTEPVAPEPQVLEPAVEVAEPETAEYQEEAGPEVVLSDEAVSQESPQQVATPKTTAPNNTAPQQPAMPGLEALMNASPEQIAAMMAYLQTLQAAKSPAAPAETTTHKAPAEQQKVPESVVPETTTPASSGAEAVATMTQPAEPAQQEPDTSQAVSETPGREPTPTESAILEPVEAESDFVVDPIPDPPSSDEDAVLATTQEAERLHQSSELIGTAPESDFIVDPIPDSPTSEDDSAMATTPRPERLHQSSEVIGTASEPLSVPESLDSAEVVGAPEQTNTLESAVAADHAVGEQEGESSSMHDSLDPAKDEASSVDRSLSSVIDQELEKRDREEHAEQLAENEDATLEALGEAGDELLDEAPEPSRLPRNVAAYYLQPLRRVAEYGVPACDLQLRSYSIRPLESFCDFALRAAYYLGLPAYGPVPLPKIIERWTVPKSSFIFKKSQENFERITRRRLIQIKDAHPETVQIWLAFLQKHQQAAVGMKANIWEFSSIDVAKQMDEAFKDAEPLINDKYRLLQQNKEFETVEKVDEFLQAERYRRTGDQVERRT